MLLILLVIAIGYGLFELIFYFTHRKPLKESEIPKLMRKRRRQFIRKHFVFKKVAVYPDPAFKSGMKPNGQMYSADISLMSFPSYTANLLKGKKHEWVVIAFVLDDTVKCFYANKGSNNQSVSFNLNTSELINICKANGYQSIIRLHNHPNSDPYHTTTLLASQQDKNSANYLSDITVAYGINWFDFVCERGNYIQFARKISDWFFPTVARYEYISAQNQEARNYYKLQRELGLFR